MLPSKRVEPFSILRLLRRHPPVQDDLGDARRKRPAPPRRQLVRHPGRAKPQRQNGLQHFPFIGRVSRGFDFLGVDFQPGAPLVPSAVSLARKTEKIARLYEQGASQERIGRYETHWARWLRSLTDRSDPAAPAPQARPPRHPTPRLSDDPSVSSPPSPPGRWGALNTSNREDENKTDQDRSFRSQVATGRHGPRGHHRQLAGGHRADHPHGE